MATNRKTAQTFNAEEWISKSKAARLRGVSRQAIWELVKRGRLRTSVFNGRAYLKRADVLKFKHRKRGPYFRIPAAEVLARATARNPYLEELQAAKRKAEKCRPSQWLSLTEAATALQISPQAVSDLISSRRLKATVIVDSPLVSRSSVKKFKSRQLSPTPKSASKSKRKHRKK
ncbi:MAG TPA: hypothetical protein VKL99_00445 [Candidatus Angelobacter sp.]|nr:hypothetical protein [Candidatus Angelobacter sp.]